MAKKTRKKSSGKVEAIPATKTKSVTLKQISNGYLVSTWTDKGEKEAFAKNLKDAKIIAGKLL